MGPMIELFIELLPVLLKLLDCPDSSAEGVMRQAREPHSSGRRLFERAYARRLARDAGTPFRWRRFMDDARRDVSVALTDPNSEAQIQLACIMCGCEDA